MLRSVLLMAVALSIPLFAEKSPKDPKDWIGHKISEMVANHGAPSTVYQDPETKLQVYVWTTQSSQALPGRVQTHNYGYGVQHQTVYPGPEITRKQYKMFWVDTQGTISRWKEGRSR